MKVYGKRSGSWLEKCRISLQKARGTARTLPRSEKQKTIAKLTGYRMGKSNIGNKQSLVTLEKRRKSLTGHNVSENTRLKIGSKNKIKLKLYYSLGGKTWNKGLTKESDCRVRRQSDRVRGRKKSPEHIQKALRASLKSLHIKPNKFESKALNYLNSIYNNSFVYIGDGSYLVNGRSPDAISRDYKTVALFHGVYWHLTKICLENTPENKKLVEDRDSIHFIKEGFSVIGIWEDDLVEMTKG